jgi:hypothetical protein
MCTKRRNAGVSSLYNGAEYLIVIEVNNEHWLFEKAKALAQLVQYRDKFRIKDGKIAGSF